MENYTKACFFLFFFFVCVCVCVWGGGGGGGGGGAFTNIDSVDHMHIKL